MIINNASKNYYYKIRFQVSYGGVAVPKSPFRVFVAQPLNPSKVQIFGPGIESGVKTNKPNHFTIDCSDAGIGTLICFNVLNPSKRSSNYNYGYFNLSSLLEPGGGKGWRLC